MAGQRVSLTITGPGPYFFYACLLLVLLGTLFGFFWPPWGPYGPYGLVPQISCLALPTNIKNRSYMQVLFSLFHCKPIWAHFFAFFDPPPAICTSKVVMCPRTPNLISCPATQIKNSTFLVNLKNFFNFFPLKAFLGTFFGLYLATPGPIRTPRGPLKPCTLDLMSYPANLPKNRTYLQNWFIFLHSLPF